MLCLILAEKWGTPPWAIEDHPDSRYWAARYMLLEDERAKARE